MMSELKPLRILYRGPLASCNYGCWYCPFAKQRDSLAEHRADAAALARFVDWTEAQAGRWALSILFTPWGEALIHGRYQRAFVRLTQHRHIRKVVIQTNLSGRLDWVDQCDPGRMALWATYHPGETEREAFLRQCTFLFERGVHFSVGVVGLNEHAAEIEALRRDLPPDVYLWINAFKRQPDYYSEDMQRRLEAIDGLFALNNTAHPSQGRACQAGHTAIAVDGAGTMRRCHFIKAPIGNIFDADWETALKPRPCPNATCRCYIGYMNLDHLQLDAIYGERLLERIPVMAAHGTSAAD